MSNTTLVSGPSAGGGQTLLPPAEIHAGSLPQHNTVANRACASSGLVSCFGILENALVLWVVGFRLRRRTVASVWVLNLALLGAGRPLCSAKASIFFLNMFVSAFLLAAISLDRCSGGQACVEPEPPVGGVCLEAGSYVLFALSLRKRRTKRKQSWLEMGASTKSHNILNTPHASTPIVSVKPSSSSPSATSNKPKNGLLSQSFTKMVTSVIAAFALCWAPYHIVCLIEVAAHYLPQEPDAGRATMFAFLNPVLNPILYAFSCPDFCVRIRQSLGSLFEGLVEEGEGSIKKKIESFRRWSSASLKRSPRVKAKTMSLSSPLGDPGDLWLRDGHRRTLRPIVDPVFGQQQQ
ncbi:LOW QUALITY PROTEIN: hypothetical protein CRUP_005093 [Coryphaenoides rupestris]|nr:LOW QUALITY PROTEIN: hypothetical protein CRUP_005093 [Coryphaenoides rupestris]